MAEGVGETGAEQRSEFGTFFIGETGVTAVGLRVFQVDFLMSHVEVAAKNHRLFGIELLEVGSKVVFPLHAIVESAQFVLRVRHIGGHQIEVGHLKRDYASLVVVKVDADAIAHAQRCVAGEDCRARIAFFVGIVPIRLIALEVQVKLSGLHFGFLKAEEVGIELLECVLKSFSHTGTKPVHVPRYEFHNCYVKNVFVINNGLTFHRLWRRNCKSNYKVAYCLIFSMRNVRRGVSVVKR